MLVVTNFSRTTLRAAITPSSTSLLLAQGGGAYFAIGSGNYMYLTIEDGNSVEIVKFTNSGIIVNDTLTGVARGQDGTTAKSFPAGACVKVAWNVAQVQELVTQTYIDLFASSVIPPNTIEVSGEPIAPPPPNVIYAIDTLQHQFWYWNGASWISVANPNNGVISGPTDPSAPPINSVAFYINTNTGELFYWTGSNWQTVAGGNSSAEEYWVRSSFGPIATINSETTYDLDTAIVLPHYRTYPNNTPANSVLQLVTVGGVQRMKVTQAVAMEIDITIAGDFGSNPVPDAVMELVIANSQTPIIFGNAIAVDPAFAPELAISASTGVQAWQADTYFGPSLIYSRKGAGPWDPFLLKQLNYGFHVVGLISGP